MKTTLFAAFSLVVLLSGCTHYYYVANNQNIPLFRENNEYRVTGSIGGGDESSCTEIQTAYSVTDKIGIMANYMHAVGGDLNSSNNAKGHFLEGAVGYYKPLGSSGSFELFSGLGMGSQEHRYDAYQLTNPQNTSYESASLSYFRYFLQPSYGLTFHLIDIAWSSRLCILNYTNVYDRTYGNMDVSRELSSISSGSHVFIEPAMTIRMGWKSVKGQLQFVYVDKLSHATNHFYEESHVSLGLNIALSGNKK